MPLVSGAESKGALKEGHLFQDRNAGRHRKRSGERRGVLRSGLAEIASGAEFAVPSVQYNSR